MTDLNDSPKEAGNQLHTPKDNVASLGPAFVQGWRSLPDEMKMEILSHILAFGPIINQDHFNNLSTFSRRPYSIFPIHLLWSNREIAGLAKEVLYSRNLFAIDGDLSSIAYPKQPVNSWIRRVELHLTLYQRNWAFLSRFARGDLGFQNLLCLEVELHHYPDLARYNPEDPRDTLVHIQNYPIELKIRKLQVNFTGYVVCYTSKLMNDWLKDAIFGNLRRAHQENKASKAEWNETVFATGSTPQVFRTQRLEWSV